MSYRVFSGGDLGAEEERRTREKGNVSEVKRKNKNIHQKVLLGHKYIEDLYKMQCIMRQPVHRSF